MKSLVGFLVIALGVAGCTTALNSKNVVANGTAPVRGVLYALPMAVFDVEAKFVVTWCTKTANVANLQYELAGGTIKQRFAADPLETYRLDYAELNSSLKTTSATVSMHPNGMIKSINAEVEDRTAQALTSVAGAVLNLYKASTLNISPVAAASGCTTLAEMFKTRDRLLSELPQARAEDDVLKKDREALKIASANYEEALAAHAEAVKAKDNLAIRELAKKLEKLKAALLAATKLVADRKFTAPTKEAELAKVTEELTVTASLPTWVPRGTTTSALVCEPVEVDQQAFINRVEISQKQRADFTLPPDAKFSAEACAQPLTGSKVTAAPSDSMESTHSGVVYRLPATGNVWLRLKDDTANTYSRMPTTLPQFGTKGLVWLENKAFDKNNVKVSFNEDGSLADLTYAAQSRAEKAAAAASDVSGTVVSLMQLRLDAAKARTAAVDEEQKKAQQKQIDAIDAQIALLQKRKDLEAARLPAKDAAEKEKEQLQKEIELEKLRQELADLKKKASSP